jgi:hypothetical protein
MKSWRSSWNRDLQDFIQACQIAHEGRVHAEVIDERLGLLSGHLQEMAVSFRNGLATQGAFRQDDVRHDNLQRRMRRRRPHEGIESPRGLKEKRNEQQPIKSGAA